jgi:hypothetical protein
MYFFVIVTNLKYILKFLLSTFFLNYDFPPEQVGALPCFKLVAPLQAHYKQPCSTLEGTWGVCVCVFFVIFVISFVIQGCFSRKFLLFCCTLGLLTIFKKNFLVALRAASPHLSHFLVNYFILYFRPLQHTIDFIFKNKIQKRYRRKSTVN